ncbi:MAG: peptidase, partial [Bacteroidetes bacterium]|nr:peptidase [Bacteroidota bacterium]
MKLTIGRKDKADFPELKLTNISCKIDTGAYTSTIHSHDIKEIIIDGEKYIEFQLLDPSHPKYREEKLKTKNFTKKNIKNSFGITEERFVIKTIIKIFENEYPIELSLSERSDMKNPILIGRTLLNNRFIVD